MGKRYELTAILPLALLGLLSVSACATNPLTGKDDFVLLSDEWEIEVGKAGAEEVTGTMGLYDNPALTAYVDRIGKAMAAKSERPELPWQFQVVDDPMVNAFALGGGQIFVTRGLLAHLSSGAQLATVIGHEIGHVTARHAGRQMSKNLAFMLAMKIGKAVRKDWSSFESLLNPAFGLLMLRYSRDDEREADNLGYRYAVANGYEIREGPGVFTMFKRVAAAEGADGIPVWQSSHPDSGARAEHFARLTAETAPAAGTVGTDEFLALTDQLVFGPDPRQGYFEGGVFKHPTRTFQIVPPAGWSASVTKRALLLTPVEGEGAAKIDANADGSTPAEALEKYLSDSEDNEELTRGDPFTIGSGTSQMGARFVVKNEGKELHGGVVFFPHAGGITKAGFLAAPENLSVVESAFRASLATFATLSDPAALGVQPARLRVMQVPQRMSLADFAKSYPAVPVERLAIMNHLDPEARLEPGQKIKVVEGKVPDGAIKPK